MKKCPKCNANIEDDARFCLYCMSSLDDKVTIENKIQDKKWWLYMLAIVLSVVLILGLLILVLSRNSIDMSSNHSLPPSESTSLGGFTHNDSDLPDDTLFENTFEDSSKTFSDNSSTNDSSPKNPSKSTSYNDNSSNNETDSSNSQSSSEIVDSSEQTPVVTPPSQSEPTESNNSEIADSSEQSSTDAPTQTIVTYEYRDATTTDCFPTGYTPVYTPENVIVITGVNGTAADGIYIVPEIIDGKKVAAIMPDAFSGKSISSTVKKVVLPATIRTIWQDAFSECYNLTDIYINSEVIGIYESAFPDIPNRTGTLTIHCKHNCRNFDFYYYRNICDDYGAQYQEWNGGDIV